MRVRRFFSLVTCIFRREIGLLRVSDTEAKIYKTFILLKGSLEKKVFD